MDVRPCGRRSPRPADDDGYHLAMRRSAEQTASTRARIVAIASRRFREKGSRGTGIAPIMREARLTHGGFYRHFSSSAQLFEEALAAGLDEMASRMTVAAARAPAGQALAVIIGTYLSPEHAGAPGTGCPLAALGADLARLPRQRRAACHRLLLTYARRLSIYLPGRDADSRERQAVVLFSSMAGTLMVARTITDTRARAALLEDARAFHLAQFA